MTKGDASDTGKSYEKLIGRFCKWAETRSDIRIAYTLGSSARIDHPADEWSDLDIVFWTTDPKHYLSTSDWISKFGKPLLTFIDTTLTGDDKMRVVLYEGMLDVDFVPISYKYIRRTSQWIHRTIKADSDREALAGIWNVYGRGVRVLTDKDGLACSFSAIPASLKKRFPPRPTHDEFLEVVNDFFYHAVYTAKHLRRGELWWAVTHQGCRLQRPMLQMIMWHALAKHDWKHDVWFLGRFLEEWANPEAVEGLREAFAQYDKENVKRALFATIDLFRALAIETATKMGYPYPAKADKNVTKWIRKCVSEASMR
jgi:aminoglycoside 6-adenylyltransferase